MIKEALEWLVANVDPSEYEIGGRNYTGKPVVPVRNPSPKSLELHTLSSLLVYLDKLKIDTKEEPIFIQVVDPSLVKVFGVLDHWEDRKCFATVSTKLYADPFPFGQKLSMEDMMIKLQSCFSYSYDLEVLQRLLGNIQAGKVKTSVDDGVSQTVHTKAGATLVTQEPIPTEVFLNPYRTFRDIAQPQSKFFLRLHQRDDEMPMASLWEKDGSAWKLDAMNLIKDFLSLCGLPILS